MRYRKYNFLVLVSVLFLIMAVQTPLVFAGSAKISWNANTESDLAGYKIYYGTSPRTGSAPKDCNMCNYMNKIDNIGKTATPSAPSYTFNNLTDGQTYYFAVTAYDTSGNESIFSSPEISKTIGTVVSLANITLKTSIEGPSVAASKNFTIKLFGSGTTNLAAQSSAITNISGDLLFSSISAAAGAYDIIISSPYYLSKKMTSISLSSNATISLPRLLGGDLNNTNTVGDGDWSAMSPFWFTSDSGNNGRADINGDGIVNTGDFGIMYKNWGQTGN